MTNTAIIEWTSGDWLNPPPAISIVDGQMVVESAAQSDFWRESPPGPVRDSGHALLSPFPLNTAMEVTFRADFDQLYDQAGIMIRVDEATWIKAGVEFTDGEPHIAAVATREVSDWSLAPAPDWRGQLVTVRASRSGNAVSVRVRTPDTAWRMIRLAPLASDAIATAGPMCCSPQRGGLHVTFTRFASGPSDAELHAEEG